MNESVEKTSDDNSWLSIILPLVMTVAVSIGTTTLYQRLAEPRVQAQESESKVLILALKDWVSVMPESGQEGDINAHFAKARAAADRAAAQGYVVLNESQAVAFPAAARLKPGMFEAEVKQP